MRFLITIARMYPGRSALTLLSLLFAGAAEGLSLLFLLPLLNLVTSDDARFTGNGLSGLGHMLTEALSAIGEPPGRLHRCPCRDGLATLPASLSPGCPVGVLRAPTCGQPDQCHRNRGDPGVTGVCSRRQDSGRSHSNYCLRGRGLFYCVAGCPAIPRGGSDGPLWAAPARPHRASCRHAPDSTAQVSFDPFGRQPSIGQTSESDGA